MRTHGLEGANPACLCLPGLLGGEAGTVLHQLLGRDRYSAGRLFEGCVVGGGIDGIDYGCLFFLTSATKGL